MPAFVATKQVSAEEGGSAVDDVVQHPTLRSGQTAAAERFVCASMLADDIGHLQGGAAHRPSAVLIDLAAVQLERCPADLEVVLGDVQIPCRGVQTGMAQEPLEDSKVGSGF